MAENPDKRFENFIAVQLARDVSCWNENGLGPLKLHYLRTKDGQEVDFAIAGSKGIILLIEAKLQDTSLSRNLAFFQEKTRAPLAFQVINQKNFCAQKAKGLYIIGADRFLSLLP